jgi:hypothetical protein
MPLKYHESYVETYAKILKFCFGQFRTNAEISFHIGRKDPNTFGFLAKLVRDGFMEKQLLKGVVNGKLFIYRAKVDKLPSEVLNTHIRRLQSPKFEIEDKYKWHGNPFHQGEGLRL